MSDSSSDSSVDELHAGLAVGTRYQLLEPLGRGGMGAVWLARDREGDGRVAVKFLDAAGPMTTELRTRFEREARICAELGVASPHVARVVDHGIHDGRMPYFVLEHLRGRPLDAELGKPRSLAFATEICRQVGAALEVAHDAGIVHRDIKPANVFVCEPDDGGASLVKLLDFGIAKARRPIDAPLEEGAEPTTRAGQVLGTPSYMSPEQLTADREIDARSDLWALTALVYRIVVGEPPFGAGEASSIGVRILALDPSAPSAKIPGLPSAFDRWVRKGLAKRKGDRFSSASELVAALVAIAEPAAKESSNAPIAPTAPTAPTAPRPAGRPVRTFAWVLLGIAVSAVTGIVVTVAARRSPRAPTQGVTSSTSGRMQPSTSTVATPASMAAPSAPSSAVVVASSASSAAPSAKPAPPLPLKPATSAKKWNGAIDDAL